MNLNINKQLESPTANCVPILYNLYHNLDLVFITSFISQPTATFSDTSFEDSFHTDKLHTLPGIDSTPSRDEKDFMVKGKVVEFNSILFYGMILSRPLVCFVLTWVLYQNLVT